MNQANSKTLRALGLALFFVMNEAVAACIPTTTAAGPTPVMAGTGQLTYGNGTTVNGTTVTGALNGIPTSGATTAAAPALPALVPATFPATCGGTLNTAGTVAAGCYGTINASGNPTVFSGGTYYIDTLNASRSLQFGPGTYYINNLNMNGNGSSLTVTGAVQLFIGNSFDVNAINVSINPGGNAGNLQVNLYSNAQVDTNGKNNFSFTGLIYSPFANAQVQIDGNNNSITGAIITAGQVQLGQNTAINYNATVQAQVTALACPVAGPDHIEIDHTGSGLTCSPQTVTIKACANAACTTLYTAGGVNVTLTPGGLNFAIGVSGSNNAATVQQSTAGVATLAATPTPAAANPTTCLNTVTATASCAMTFSSSGFLVTVPNHVSCTNATATIEAVQQAGASNRCVPAYRNVTRAVNLYTSYTNPTTGTKIVTASTGAVSTAAPGTTHNLAFDVTGKATITLSYPDAGQLTLTATDTAPTGAAMTGSGTFIAAPASFAFSAVTAPPIKAGNPFGATITAQTASGAGTACPVALATPNFGKETAPEGVTLGANLVSPAAGNNPALGGNVVAGGSFTNGAATLSNLTWGEVGNITLTAALTSGNYLASGLTATGTSATVGAFIPDHFDTAVVATATVPMPCRAGLTCPALYNGFVYSGQPFSEQVTARNLANGTTTNYHSAYGLSNNVTLTAWDAPGSVVTQNPPGGTSVLASLTMASTAFSSGVGLTSTQAYTFATSPTAPTDIFLRAVDAVNTTVTSRRAPANTSVEGGVKVVSGRMKLFNAQGSELLQLPIVVTAQYWNSTTYVTSTTDSVSSFVATNVVFGNYQKNLNAINYPNSGATSVTPASVVFASGVASYKLAKPGAGNNGSVNMNITGLSYLLSNTARATFGVYKGAKEFIYLRENY